MASTLRASNARVDVGESDASGDELGSSESAPVHRFVSWFTIHNNIFVESIQL